VPQSGQISVVSSAREIAPRRTGIGHRQRGHRTVGMGPYCSTAPVVSSLAALRQVSPSRP
jgi:hypothetical protein